MSILNGILKYKKYKKTNENTYQLMSVWTSADTVHLNDGTSVQTSLDDIKGITGENFTNMQDNLTQLTKEVDGLKKSVADGKSRISSAITVKGVATSSNDSFATMAENINKVCDNQYNVGFHNGTSAASSPIILTAVETRYNETPYWIVDLTYYNKLYMDASSWDNSDEGQSYADSRLTINGNELVAWGHGGSNGVSGNESDGRKQFTFDISNYKGACSIYIKKGWNLKVFQIKVYQ